MKKNLFLSGTLLVLLLLSPLAKAQNAEKEGAPPRASLAARLTVVPLLKVYRNYLSPFIITRCPSWPNCSRYAAQAVAKHGVVLGVFMTVDRLIHEAGEIEHGPKIFVEGQGYRIYDPLSNNDFWWSKPPPIKPPDIPQLR